MTIANYSKYGSKQLMLVATSLLMTLFVSAAHSETTSENDVTAQLQEGLDLSRAVIAAVKEFYLDQGRFPLDHIEARLIEPNEIRGRFVLSVKVGPGDGIVTIEYGNYAAPIISGSTLLLVPEIQESTPIWKCSSEYISAQIFPAKCEI